MITVNERITDILVHIRRGYLDSAADLLDLDCNALPEQAARQLARIISDAYLRQAHREAILAECLAGLLSVETAAQQLAGLR